MKYKRILLKLSGEALMGDRQYGIDPHRLSEYAQDIKQVVEQGVEVAIVMVVVTSLGVLQVLATEWIESRRLHGYASNSNQRPSFTKCS